MNLNFTGLASLPKKLAVKRLIEKQSLDVIFLQETMCVGDILIKDMKILLKGWQFVSIDAKCRSGGSLLGWRIRNFILMNAWAMSLSLYVVLHSIESQLDITFLNLYGPYLDRENFWNHLSGMDCFKSTYLVFGGDLNFSLGLSDIWGVNAHVDALTDYFTNILVGLGLVDIAPLDSIPTWSNRRVGTECICKRLDKLLLSAYFLYRDFIFKQWIGSGGDSDHQPVFLQLSSNTSKKHCPFKFNACWLEHAELVEILKDSWVVYDALSEVSLASQFVMNLKRIKYLSIDWSLTKKA